MSGREDGAEQRVLNEQIIRQFELAGDDLTRPRLVAHSALFPNDMGVQTAVVALRELGFHVELAGEDDKRVLFSRIDRLTRETVETVTRSVLDIVAASHGAYEGWAAAMLAPERTSP